MSSTSKLWVALVVILVIAISGFYYPQITDRTKDEATDEVTVGAVSTLDGVDSPFVSIGGYRRYYYHQAMFATSSVVCSIKNPFNATSTLLGYKFQVTTNGIAVAQTLDVSTSSSAYASSSPAYIRAFAGGTGQFSGIWGGVSTTTSSGLIGLSKVNDGKPFASPVGYSDNIIGPTDYVNLRIATSSPGTFTNYYKGTCSGVIERL